MQWVTLNADMLAEAFQETECQDLLALRSTADPVPGICAGIAARIRAAVQANGRTQLAGGECDIPQALRGEAVAILRVQVLTRYDMTISDPRRDAATAAEARLDAIAKGEYPLAMDAVATKPTYHARKQRWGQPGSGGLMPSLLGRRPLRG